VGAPRDLRTQRCTWARLLDWRAEDYRPSASRSAQVLSGVERRATRGDRNRRTADPGATHRRGIDRCRRSMVRHEGWKVTSSAAGAIRFIGGGPDQASHEQSARPEVRRLRNCLTHHVPIDQRIGPSRGRRIVSCRKRSWWPPIRRSLRAVLERRRCTERSYPPALQQGGPPSHGLRSSNPEWHPRVTKHLCKRDPGLLHATVSQAPSRSQSRFGFRSPPRCR